MSHHIWNGLVWHVWSLWLFLLRIVDELSWGSAGSVGLSCSVSRSWSRVRERSKNPVGADSLGVRRSCSVMMTQHKTKHSELQSPLFKLKGQTGSGSLCLWETALPHCAHTHSLSNGNSGLSVVRGWVLYKTGGFKIYGLTKSSWWRETALSRIAQPTRAVQYVMSMRGVRGLKSEFSMLVTMVTHADHILFHS